jgi:hypothetical protein
MNMSYMFYGAVRFNSDVSEWSTGSLETLSYMFYAASSFNGDVSGWDVDIYDCELETVFQGAVRFKGPLDNWRIRILL